MNLNMHMYGWTYGRMDNTFVYEVLFASLMLANIFLSGLLLCSGVGEEPCAALSNAQIAPMPRFFCLNEFFYGCSCKAVRGCGTMGVPCSMPCAMSSLREMGKMGMVERLETGLVLNK